MLPSAVDCYGSGPGSNLKVSFIITLAVLYSCRAPADVISTCQVSEEGRGCFSTSTNTKYLSCRFVSEEDGRRKRRERKRWEKMPANSYGLWEIALRFSKSRAELHSRGSWRWDLF